MRFVALGPAVLISEKDWHNFFVRWPIRFCALASSKKLQNAKYLYPTTVLVVSHFSELATGLINNQHFKRNRFFSFKIYVVLSKYWLNYVTSANSISFLETKWFCSNRKTCQLWVWLRCRSRQECWFSFTFRKKTANTFPTKWKNHKLWQKHAFLMKTWKTKAISNG